MKMIHSYFKRSDAVNMDKNMIMKAIEKNKEFWKLTNKEPLLARIPFSGFNKKPYPVKDGREIMDPERLFPIDIDIDRLIGVGKSNPEPFNGDMVNFAGCLYPEAWMESIIGCPIYASAFSCSSKPVSEDIESAMDEFTVEGALKSEWFEVMNNVMKKLIDKAGDDLPVRQLHFRGVIDMLAAFMGEEKLCFSIYDYPEKVAELGDKFADERETGVFKKEFILESCKKIQAASKSVIVNGELNEDELAEFKEKLNPAGLAIFYWKPV